MRLYLPAPGAWLGAVWCNPAQSTNHHKIMNAQNSLIYVQVPHQRNPKAFAFADDASFIEWLEESAPPGFSYRTFTRPEWDSYVAETENEIGGDDWIRWDKPGYDLFDAGAKEIVQVWRNESNRELFPLEDAPEKVECLMDAIDDFHTHYVVREERWKAIESGDLTGIQTHQQHETAAVIRDAAEELGWISAPAALKIGDRVSVPEESVPATVAEICEDGTVSLIFDDKEQGYYWPADVEKL